MKRVTLFLFSVILILGVFAGQATIMVPTFYTYEEDWNSQMPVITDIVRSELVNQATFRVYDFSVTDSMIESYSKGKDETQKTENLLKALGTDYLLIGIASRVKEEVEYHTETITVEREVDRGVLGEIGKYLLGERAVKTKTEQREVSVATQDSTITVVLRIIRTADSEVIASVRASLYKWADFSLIASSLTDALITSFEKNQKMNTPFEITGKWSGELYSSPYYDIYHFEFLANGVVNVFIDSYDSDGNLSKVNGTGRFKYDSKTQVVSLTINRLTGNLKHLQNIRWSSAVIVEDTENYTMIIPVSSVSDSRLVSVDFYRDESF